MAPDELESWVREHERWRGRVEGKLETLVEALTNIHTTVRELKIEHDQILDSIRRLDNRRKWPDMKRLAGFGAVVAGVVSGVVEMIKKWT